MNIVSYDHVGIRVTDRARSLAFYADLGFEVDPPRSNETAIEIVNAQGIRLNLIVNAVPTPEGDNILLDRPEKWPGYTHAAFVVDRLDDVVDWAKRRGTLITEGPVDWGRRITCFLRDPDLNVLEFNELKPEAPYTLVLGQKNYSSWSMRVWLLMRFLRLPFEATTIPLYTQSSRAEVKALGGETGLVPVLRQGALAIWDTLSIFEHLHETYGRVWPSCPIERARARSICGEVHSSFNALREAMPVNTRARNRAAVRSADVETDIDRITDIWSRYPRGGGQWLFGDFGGADIMFAPIATRFQTYGVELPEPARAYQTALLLHPLVDEWLSLGSAETDTISVLEVG
ncbi:MAG TPA: glutathione S-transferase N-terminal domain-containing protein [Sphingomicrobium sp.]|nr:glutathione S-transferase N-terminal domain-containing protein [Sphingomicrobium sp.]